MHNLNTSEYSRGRKRRNSEDEEMDDISHRSLLAARKELKKHKSIQKRTARIAILETMEKEALIHIIQNFLHKQPELIRDVMTYIPEPTIASAMNVLLDMEKKFINSFPFNKHGPGRDDYTFSRDTLVRYANHFISPRVFPTTTFTFLDYAAHIAHRLPVWDNENHNRLKQNLYQQLNEFWKTAIQSTASKLREGEIYSPESVSEWAKSLAQHDSFTGGFYFTESVHEFTKQLGFMIGLTTANDLEDKAATPVCHLAPLETTFTSTSVVGDRR
ncbi:hypothetical protein RMCBS344292_15859 [Rhizopus microsporus]|nr:hypothetical protein RMCBS344292_12249 [Rhizopus microsporus]CEJ01838.1 hypothetical protein RMCBS344292_15859 [Rhizopus microsporus]